MTFDPTWEEQARVWARFARSPDHDHFFWELNAPSFLDLVPLPGRRTLDVACGEGRLGRLLRERGHHVVAIDAAPSLARMAREAGGQDVVIGNAGSLPLAARSVDLAVAFMSLQDIPDLDSAVAEVARVLVDGGRFCIAIAHPLRSGGGFFSKDPESEFALSSYFETRPWMWSSQHTGLRLELPGIHRPLQAYTLALQRCGFVIEVLREPRPAPEHLAKHPEYARWMRIPCFLHLRALRRAALA